MNTIPFWFFILSVYYYLQIDIDGNIMHKWERSSKKKYSARGRQGMRDTESVEQTKIILMFEIEQKASFFYSLIHI